jgi:hypothetical protein
MMQLLPGKAAMATNLTQPFSAVGGTPPYAYSVLSGVGTIDPVTGLYSSGVARGQAVVQAIDSTLFAASAQIQVLSPIELLCDIIASEMGLASGRVYLWDQKIPMPTDPGLFIELRVISLKPFSNVFQFDPATGNEVQTANFHASVDVNVQSRDTSARERKEEVILALRSQYARNQMSLNSFYVSGISTSFNDLSEVDGAAIPYRFVCSIALQFAVTKTKAVPYFDTFSAPSITVDP